MKKEFNKVRQDACESGASVLMPASKRIEFPCNTAAGREAARALRHFLSQHGLDENLLFACELSLTEAANNAVHHYQGPADGSPGTEGASQTAGPEAPPITAEATITNTHIEMAVTDHTPGFEWPGQLPPPEPEIANGRGLFLIQAMMDEAGYRRGKDGNVLWMRKRRWPRAAQPQPG